MARAIRKRPVCFRTRHGQVVFGATRSDAFCTPAQRGDYVFKQNVSRDEVEALEKLTRSRARHVPRLLGWNRGSRPNRYHIYLQSVGAALRDVPNVARLLTGKKQKLMRNVALAMKDMDRAGVYHNDLHTAGAVMRNITYDEPSDSFYVIDFGRTKSPWPSGLGANAETRRVLSLLGV